MIDEQRSPITGQPARVTPHPEDGYIVASEAEGRYTISDHLAISFASEVPEPLRHRLLAAVRRASDAGRQLSLTITNVVEIAESEPDIDPTDLPDAVLKLVYRRSQVPGEDVTLNTAVDYPLICGRNADSMEWATDSAMAMGLIQEQLEWMHGNDGAEVNVSITAAGWRRLRELRDVGLDSMQAFIAMWFGAEMTPAWTDGIRPAFDGTGWAPLRIDAVEHNDRIDARIVAEINRSGLVVADVTGGRQGVYFEAGYALGRGLPVIWTVREDDLKNLHFDTRQYSHVVWKTPDELREKLHYRILATAPRTGTR